MNLQTHILPRRKNTSTYLITTTSTHHNPLTPFTSSTCPYLHCHIFDTNIITKFSSTNNKHQKERHNYAYIIIKTSPNGIGSPLLLFFKSAKTKRSRVTIHQQPFPIHSLPTDWLHGLQMI